MSQSPQQPWSFFWQELDSRSSLLKLSQDIYVMYAHYPQSVIFLHHLYSYWILSHQHGWYVFRTAQIIFMAKKLQHKRCETLRSHITQKRGLTIMLIISFRTKNPNSSLRIGTVLENSLTEIPIFHILSKPGCFLKQPKFFQCFVILVIQNPKSKNNN